MYFAWNDETMMRPSVIYSVPCDRIVQRAYRVRLTHHIMQIWEETVANLYILPVWTFIANNFFTIIIIVESTLFCKVLFLIP